LRRIKIGSEGESLSVFWGDIHIHTGFSHCFWLWEREGGELDEMYEFARDKARLDFVSLTDHSGDITEDIWRQMQEKASEYNSPGRFVTFLGYEWSVSQRGPWRA